MPFNNNNSKKTPPALNIVAQCRYYGVSLRQCPQFLFLLMGLIIIISSITLYFIGTQFISDPEIVSLMVLGVTMVLFVMAFTITKSFERLAEASKMKSEFINIVSHQLRSPLTNLKWTVEIFSSQDLPKDPEKEKEYYNNLRENIARMVELVDDLLIVSKLEQGVFPLRKKEFVFGDLIKEMVERFKFFSEASGIKVNFFIQENLPLIFSDYSQLKLVVENLIDNAIRYTKKGGSIDIKVTKNAGKILFAVKDSGVGIPEEDKKYIFQKFFRAENAFREQTKGSGLGLFIVKSIIERLGGKIWFESEEDKGTTFFFTLPIK
jgi:signal transduction histidine kinase